MKKDSKIAAFLLALFLVMPMTNAMADKFVTVKELKTVTSAQKTPVWCWAAVMQMMLNLKGVNWTQEDVVMAVKGQLSAVTATDYEMTQFLNGWGFDYDGQRWKAIALNKSGAPKANDLFYEFEHGRPIIIKYATGPYMNHVVVAYGAHSVDAKDGKQWLDGVFIFDPYTGTIEMMPGPDFFKNVKAHWLVDVKKF